MQIFGLGPRKCVEISNISCVWHISLSINRGLLQSCILIHTTMQMCLLFLLAAVIQFFIKKIGVLVFFGLRKKKNPNKIILLKTSQNGQKNDLQPKNPKFGANSGFGTQKIFQSYILIDTCAFQKEKHVLCGRRPCANFFTSLIVDKTCAHPV